MTLEQLTIFVEVAEREHLTRAAEALNLTPSAVSSAIRKLEDFYRVTLFDRVGRGIVLTAEGKAFLDEARATLSRIRSAERVLAELGGLERGALSVFASQTIGSYWLPKVLMRFHARYPGIKLKLSIGNTTTVADAVAHGEAELGYIEGTLDNPLLRKRHLTDDALMVVVSPEHPLADGRPVTPGELARQAGFVLREEGSGTRFEFENAMADFGIAPADLNVVMVLPSNEAVLSAVRSGQAATAISGAVAEPWLASGGLKRVNFDLPSRAFQLLSHKERHLSKAAEALVAFSLEG
ncbi:LysR substrate-binding domain-containing protein [Martelella endophytica]|uniref:LysR family transcriptional regulator n=1 Tax=Martelella endophytica TaxID=1486262 RepID=A0A0D5LV44_MAREN|nr:LysR substrate-binding domain-containing protein [Martelella endophytica]AJY48144.1 LysR family transcriptional regulator [Martelella endophytica]